MLRYIVAIGNPTLAADCEQIVYVRHRVQTCSDDWVSAIVRPGIYMAYVERADDVSSAIALPDSRGLIFGSLYKSHDQLTGSSAAAIRSLSRSDAEVIVHSRGRSMARNYWGHYVAAFLYPEDSSCLVMRGPVSTLACFHVNLEKLTIFFSHLEDLAALDLASLSINWDCVAAQVAGGDYLTNETAINEIASVECGECVECRPEGRFNHACWDPRRLLEERCLDCFPDVARMVRDTTDHCVNALSSPHSKILVTLSGGLDSSIVLSSLRRASHAPSITAVNYHSRGTGDERRFARSMARTVNCNLVERARNHSLDLRRIEECNRTVRPVLNFSAPDAEARNIALARELRASAIFTGELGDNIFGSHPGPEALVECFRRFGPGRRYLSIAIDYAMLKKQSLWQTLAAAYRECESVVRHPDFNSMRAVHRHYGEAAARAYMLASSEVQEHCTRMEDRFIHPWLKGSRVLAPGSRSLLFGMIVITSTPYHSPFSKPSDPPLLSPLASQPLVELALRIPAYLHCKYAQDRPIARMAFADVLPSDVLLRGLGKGGPTLWVKDVVEQNNEFLREYLLNGILVRERMLDRRKLDAVLSPRIVKSTVIATDIFAKLYIEAWLRKWPLTVRPSRAISR